MKRLASWCCLAAIGWPACSEKLPSPKPNILLFTLDTTRADHLGCYGYEDAETPELDALAETGAVFETAVSQVPLTLPSHASILTGTYPPFHGVRDNGGFYLAEEAVTLAEVLEAHGYDTAAFVGSFVLDRRWGVGQGFRAFDDSMGPEAQRGLSLDSVQRRGGEVVQSFFDWLGQGRGRPFFAWLHFYDPHAPYDPPEPFNRRFVSHPYDGEIAYVDSLIGRVIDRLRERAILETTLVALVGDHGESLGEHGESTHGFFVYDATLLVPLIFRLPSSRYAGTRVASVVETVDVMPTLLELAGLPVPPEAQGRSLVPLLREPGRGDEARVAYFETRFPLYRYGWSGLGGVRSRTHKLVLAPRPELYSLAEDPGERVNAYEENAELAHRLEAHLRSGPFAPGSVAPAPLPLDDESMAKLMALGYIDGFHSSAGSGEGSGLSDPKDKIGIYDRIRSAAARLAEGALVQALREIDAALEQDPRVPQALQVRARIHLQQKDYEAAVEDCRAALEVDPDYRAALYTLAQAYKEKQDTARSARVYRRLMELDANDYKPPLNLGKIYLERGDVDRAVSYLEQSTRLDPERSAMAWNLLGAAYIQKGRLEEAAGYLRKALELRPWIHDAHYNLGLIYERKGQIRPALQELMSEIELNPRSHRAHFQLARLHEEMGDSGAKIFHLKKVLEIRPDLANVYLMLGKSYLDANRDLDEAVRLTKKGLELAPESEFAPFGYFVLADLYGRMGRRADAEEEKRKGRQLQNRLESR